MMRRRRPLMRGAMVGGVGYMAGKAGANRASQESSQEQRLAEVESQQAQPSAPPPAAAPAAGGIGRRTAQAARGTARQRRVDA